VHVEVAQGGRAGGQAGDEEPGPILGMVLAEKEPDKAGAEDDAEGFHRAYLAQALAPRILVAGAQGDGRGHGHDQVKPGAGHHHHDDHGSEV